ncbi:predicted protein [Lichtheimia corymbifera JMRC:FSU:9682]|uniref:Uncharacterized protein n=1 Tax=Lichtheimia corymbifera JMRC:FSU:9682 TaxID=1263082 RepID=A0A068RLD6_9FUNG|nr:predicted protein [Lichtheimia corymbifera JMRC:FSU:9682]
MSDYSSDNSDDEYGPIVGAWGDQKGSNEAEDDAVLSGWHSLADPNAKIGPKGLGSGGLHRQGKNYKPIEEEAILQQRKKIQVPGKKGTKKRSSRGSKGKKLPDKKGSSPRTPHSNRGETYAKKSPSGARFSRPKAPPNASSQWSQWDASQLQQQRPPPPQQQRQQPPPINNDYPSWMDSSQPARSRDNPSPTTTSSRSTTTTRPPPQQQRQQPLPINNDYPSWMDSSQPARSHDNPSPPTTSSRSTTTTRPPPSNGVSSWGNQPLVDHPFWESEPVSSPMNGQPSPADYQYKNEKSDPPVEKLIEDFDSWSPLPKRATSTDTNIPSTPPAGDYNTNSAMEQPKVDNGWSPEHDWIPAESEPWGTWNNSATTSNTTWGNTNASNGVSAEGWGDDNNNTGANEKPSGRFSNRSRPKYSTKSSKPVPANYRAGTPLVPPSKAADPPKVDNPIVVSINVELEQGTKIPINIRLHDDPSRLAYQFGRDHQIDSPAVIDALRGLFQNQKQFAMKKRYRNVNTF